MTSTTTSTNNIKKPILIIKSSENSSKTTSSRNVHFSPELIIDNKQMTIPIENCQLSSSTITDHQYKDTIPATNSLKN